MKRTDKLSRKQIMKIPILLPQKSIDEVAVLYRVSWQAVWYHIKKLRKHGVKVITRKRGQKSVIYE